MLQLVLLLVRRRLRRPHACGAAAVAVAVADAISGASRDGFESKVALAIAGCLPVKSPPPAAEENVLGADTTKFVQVPLNIVQKYWNRAKYKCMDVPEAQRLAGCGKRTSRRGLLG